MFVCEVEFLFGGQECVALPFCHNGEKGEGC